jgi:hypothetical protein
MVSAITAIATGAVSGGSVARRKVRHPLIERHIGDRKMAGNQAVQRGMSWSANPLRQHPIDMLHLAKQAMGDPGLELEVLRVFNDVVRVNFARLERSTSTEDLLVHAHTLALAATGVGAWSLAAHAKGLEAELAAGLPVNPERVDDIEMAVEELRAFIAERLEQDEDAVVH